MSPGKSPEELIARLVIQTSVWLAFMGVLLFAAAGNWRWAQAWAYLVGMPLLLGSWCALSVVPLSILGLAPRAVFESTS